MWIITREMWGAPTNRRLVIDKTPQDNRVIIHTEAGPVGKERATLQEDILHMRNIDRFHYSDRGWLGGVGYQFVVMESGRIFEGRGWKYEGGHTQGLNTESGFCFAGHGDKRGATAEQWRSMRLLIRWSIEKGYLRPDYTISGHRDHIPPGQKSCPGLLIYPHIREQLHYDRVFAEIIEQEDWLMPGEAQAIHEHIDLAVMALTGSQFTPGTIREANVFGINDLLEAQKLAQLDLTVRVIKLMAEQGVNVSDASTEEIARTVVQLAESEMAKA